MISNSKASQVQLTSYFKPGAIRPLKALNEATRVPQAAYLREALGELLKKYAATTKNRK